MPPTLLITGGTGYLGSHLIKFAGTGTTHATWFQSPPPPSSTATFHQCDLTKEKLVHQLITAVNPDIIIHTACSNKSTEEIEAIIPAASHLSRIACDRSIKLIHLSTDLVFDGRSAPYREEDLPQPLHPYGKAKARAEEIVSTVCPKSIIIRSSLMYGVDPYDHQTRWLVQGIDQGDSVRLFTDEIRSPIWVYTLAKAIIELSSLSYAGILHLAGPDALNRWDFGMAILNLVQRRSTPNVQPSTIDQSGMVRPKNLAFSIEKAQGLLNTPFLSISAVAHHLHGDRPRSSSPEDSITS